MDAPLPLLALCGSLRKGSYNRMLLNHAIGQLGANYSVPIADLASLPLYNEDLEADPPEAVQSFLRQCQEARGVLIATPEYNHSVSAALKNALDWASRPALGAPLSGKPTAVFGAATGPVGTARAQLTLRATLYVLGVDLVPKPEVLVGMAAGKFDADGRFTDEMGSKFLLQLLENFKAKVSKP